MYLREVQQELQSMTRLGHGYDCTTIICHTVKRLGLSRQKMKRVTIQRSEIKRAEYIAEIQEFKPEMLIFIDKTGSDCCSSIS